MWQIINNKRKTRANRVNDDIPPEEFSDFYCEIAENLLKSLGNSNVDPITLMDSIVRSENKFSLNKVTHNDIREVIDSLKNKKSQDIQYNLFDQDWKIPAGTKKRNGSLQMEI
ncbi:hypothetical protein NQ315_008835 [Exocentrus adspersus]|uniref:Uncharacterized protein n=1 Tax=Exocentrus adspersus TaxID=1586481 RepID=A0AAV8VCP5_9CUCU|nr:hypothetical protein NQ315_008835 [Exocentrus adspersus]